MPTLTPTLALGPGPRGVHQARRWVVEQCCAWGRPDVSECAKLGVSELVTNALLHAEPPLEVSLAGTPERPRVQVRDGSLAVPVLSSPALGDLGELGALLTFGRGLGIVARAATAWGTDVDELGKVVWFEPATELDDEEPRFRLTRTEGVRAAAKGDAGISDDIEVVLLGVPVRTHLAFQRHYRELRREIRLLTLAHEQTHPSAADLVDTFASLDVPLQAGLVALTTAARVVDGTPVVDLTVQVARSTAAGLGSFGDLLELADAFCRSERLLSLARTFEQEHFQRWFVAEFVRQSTGADPLPWTGSVLPLRSGVS